MVRCETPNLSTMVDYWDRILDALKHAGVTPKQLQENLSISYQAMKKLEEGKTKSFSAENNARAARFLGVNSFWLATGEEAMFEEKQTNNTPYAIQDRVQASKACDPVAAYIGPTWPFITLKPEQYALLSDHQKGIIEGHALEMLKSQNETKNGGTRAA